MPLFVYCCERFSLCAFFLRITTQVYSSCKTVVMKGSGYHDLTAKVFPEMPLCEMPLVFYRYCYDMGLRDSRSSWSFMKLRQLQSPLDFWNPTTRRDESLKKNKSVRKSSSVMRCAFLLAQAIYSQESIWFTDRSFVPCVYRVIQALCID